MKTTTTNPPVSRVKWRYLKQVEIPQRYQTFLWDHPAGRAPLEKFLVRLFTYGQFEDLQWVYAHYPKESIDIISRYPDIRRGVKFWIRRWHENEL